MQFFLDCFDDICPNASEVVLALNMLNCFRNHKGYIHILNPILNLVWSKVDKVDEISSGTPNTCLSYAANTIPGDALATLRAWVSWYRPQS